MFLPTLLLLELNLGIGHTRGYAYRDLGILWVLGTCYGFGWVLGTASGFDVGTHYVLRLYTSYACIAGMYGPI